MSKKTNKRNHLKIIGGKWKGRKVTFTDASGLRPTLTRTRETLFNWLRPYITDSTVLDLFAGSGSLGFEAISHGAINLTFVEIDRSTLQHLKSQTALFDQNITAIKGDAINFLNQTNKTFDIIFLDPPYKENKLPMLIDHIFQEKILKKDGIIIIHRHKKENDKFSNNLKILDEKKYGISKILFGKLN